MTEAAGRLWTFESRSDRDTRALGMRLGRACRGGEIVLLCGPLGAGKTLLAGGIARGLGLQRPLISPTYLILRSYPCPGGLRLHHCDFYRLEGDADLATVGLDDCLDERSVVVAEWPERCPGTFDAWTLRLEIEILDDTRRLIRAYGGALPVPDAWRAAPSDEARGTAG